MSVTHSDSQTPTRPDLSVVVLCYRAGERTRQVAASITSAMIHSGITSYELVLVGNYCEGVRDVTPQVVRELAANDPHIVCSAVIKQGMMGWDMRSGLVLAKGDCLAVIDGDGQILAEDLLRVFVELKRGGYDLVKARRVRRGDGLPRRLISLAFNALFHLLFPGLKIRDVNAKPKVMTRAAYQRLNLASDDWFIDAEIMIQARRLGFCIGEVETHFLALTGRRSFINVRTVVQFVGNLALYRFREFRRRKRASGTGGRFGMETDLRLKVAEGGGEGLGGKTIFEGLAGAPAKTHSQGLVGEQPFQRLGKR